MKRIEWLPLPSAMLPRSWDAGCLALNLPLGCVAAVQEPGRRWWHRRKVRKAAAEELKRLQALEERLTVEEVAHFR